MKRSEQRIEDTWNLGDLFVSEAEFEQEREVLETEMEAFAKLSGTIGESGEALLKVLSLYESLNLHLERLYVYAAQKNHQDTADGPSQKLLGRMEVLNTRLSAALSWMEPQILELDPEMLKSWIEETPGLGKYKRFLERIMAERAHTLDEKTEALLSRMNDLGRAPSDIYALFNNADIRFHEAADCEGKMHPITHGTFISLMESEDRVLRKNAFESVYKAYGQFRNTIASMYDANCRQADLFAKERHFSGAMEESLFHNEVPTEVYDHLIEAVHEKLPVMYRYVQLRKRILGVDELHMYDVYTPIAPSSQKKYTFEEAKAIVRRGLAPMGEAYLKLLDEGFEGRWIDVYENEGKRSGAYSWGAYGTHPYVLLNFNGTLDNVFTLAHEMGHALHSWHSDHALPYLDAGYRIFVAEVASTCNEALLIHDLLGRTEDPAERRSLINYFLDQFKGTIFRQTMFAEFEKLTHARVQAGESLTAEELCEQYLNLNKLYFGEDMVSDDLIRYEWERIPHFYTPFYVYQYATGFSAAIAISSKILKGEEGIIEKYRAFLSGGNSMNPIELLKLCDVDMSTSRPVLEALDVFDAYLTELEATL